MTQTTDYGFADRLLHRIAFKTWPLQVALADIEKVQFKAELERASAARPVFVAGLPRAGTTLTLRIIEGAGEFASYHYSDMPFLLMPMLWRGLTKGAKRQVEARERAHGDGVTIDIDSPEAFEEVVWRCFFPKKYQARSIATWTGAFTDEFAEFFKLQMRKVVALRAGEAAGELRYLSKCNGNIARFPTILNLLPDAVIVAPFRNPVEHARSLLRQHQQFSEMHRQDGFSREYMEAIGHYDFGLNLKPIDFGGWLDGKSPDFDRLDGWLEYWCEAYSAMLAVEDPRVRLFSYDAFCERPVAELTRLEEVLGVRRSGVLVAQAAEVRPQTLRPLEPGEASAALVERANAIYAQLGARAEGAASLAS
jgi:hypothetical protein